MALYRTLLVLLVSLPGVCMAHVLLERSRAPGHTLEEYAVSSLCTIDDDGQLAIHYQLAADLGSNRVQQLQVPVGAIRANIRAASGGKITSESIGVDGETWIYRAWKREPDGSYSEVVLLEENGGSGQKRTNNAPEARKLKNYLDLNCDGALHL